MSLVEYRQQLERKLDWQDPRIVFHKTEKDIASAGPRVEATHSVARWPLGAAFEALPLETQHAEIVLDPVANTLSLRELRLFLHRCSELLRVGGRGHMIVANPDPMKRSEPEVWPGQPLLFEGELHRYRPWRQWWELLRLFPLRPQTPLALPVGELRPKFLWLTFERVSDERAGKAEDQAIDQKYGAGSPYRRFDRLEEPEIFDDWCYAASKLRPQPGETVLSLGCNDGRELEMFSPKQRRGVRFIGVDASQSAIASARAAYPHEFHCHDLMALSELELGQVHIALLLNVLQCTSLDRDTLLQQLMDHLAPDARLLISIPNCHFGADDILRRPLDRRSKRHDRTLVHKDMRHLARTFYRHGFRRVEAFGTYDALLLVRR